MRLNRKMKRLFKNYNYPPAIIIYAVYLYCRFSLSYRDIEEILKLRGFETIDHATLQRWVVAFSPVFESEFRKRKKAVGSSWKMDETYVKVNGKWVYLYRAVDKQGHTIDFLLRAKRDKKAAIRFFKKAIKNNGVPEKIDIDKSGSNTAGIKAVNKENKINIEIRQSKYMNNRIEGDHRFIKRLTRPMLGFKSFNSARRTLALIETIHMVRKGQLSNSNDATEPEITLGGGLGPIQINYFFVPSNDIINQGA